MPDRINLVTGSSALLALFGYAAAILAAAGIVTSAAPWAWKLVSLAVLCVAAWWIFRSPEGSCTARRGMLLLDGTAVEYCDGGEELLEFTGHAWLSRMFSVIHFRETDSGRNHTWLVCAANNHPDDYRRMTGYLRLGSPGVQGGRL